MVAIGFPCPQLGPLMHNLPIHPDHVRVKVVCAIVGDAPLPVPLPNMDLEIVQDAVGTYVAWPKNLIVVSVLIFVTNYLFYFVIYLVPTYFFIYRYVKMQKLGRVLARQILLARRSLGLALVHKFLSPAHLQKCLRPPLLQKSL